MCGIAGVLRRNVSNFAVGSTLLEMARCLQHRGADSAGIAVFGAQSAPHLQMAVPVGAQLSNAEVSRVSGGRIGALERESGGFDAPLSVLEAPNSLEDLALVQLLERSFPGATVSSFGAKMSVYKGVGRVDEIAGQIEKLTGTHGIAHLRLATESKIDPAHAQPFWGRPFSDIAVTHNGHITNYFKLRQKFEARGFSFASHNDSEIIGVYLGDLMESGASLFDALETAKTELDGSFSFIVATHNALGVTRDPLATKPLLFVESEDGVTLASEPQALYRVLGSDAKIREIKPRQTKTWEL
ncbi:MAG TPA: hypothetical protein VGB45_09545 [Abditibacterium sp.]|jgi:glutamine phosphoribosylpyrophosphate amidotransferase